MNNFQRDMIALIRSSITQDQVKISEDFDWDNAVKLAKRYQVMPLFYYGTINSVITVPNEINAVLEMNTFQSVAIDNRQSYELARVYEGFEKNGIEYMPLKGSILKSIYPKSEMRPMSDADILIKTNQYEKIKSVMTDLGFYEIKESDHELVWNKKGSLHLELHKYLIPSNNEDYYSYYGDGWKFAERVEGSYRYKFSDENLLIYIFTHFAKHYRNGEIILRNIIDLYLILKNNPEIKNCLYVYGELKKLKIYQFYTNIVSLIDVWFNGAQADTVTDFITDKIFNVLSVDKKDNFYLSTAVQEMQKSNSAKKAKRKKMWQAFLPKYTDMCIKYRFLRKFPVLLPVMWFVRLADAAIFKHKDVSNRVRKLNELNSDELNAYQAELELVGLKFNFKE